MITPRAEVGERGTRITQWGSSGCNTDLNASHLLQNGTHCIHNSAEGSINESQAFFERSDVMIWSVQRRFLDFKELRRETGIDADILKSQNNPQADFWTRDHVWFQAVSGSEFIPFYWVKNCYGCCSCLNIVSSFQEFSLKKPSLTKRISLH